jgi:hypothetical protein
VLVLEDDSEWNGARLESARRLVLRDPDRDLLTSREESRSSSWFAFDADSFVRDEPSGLRSGETELIGEEFVESLSVRAENSKLNLLRGTASCG